MLKNSQNLLKNKALFELELKHLTLIKNVKKIIHILLTVHNFYVIDLMILKPCFLKISINVNNYLIE
jgi:hypothetical protein